MTELAAALARLGVPTDARVAVAFSGGLDSTALLHLAVEALSAPRVLALHVDHGVRADSRADEVHCAAVSGALGVEYRARRLPDGAAAGEGGFEASLRAARYAALAAMCEEVGATYLATAHQADDALETHLLALVRGSGLTGLGGPRPRRALTSGVTLVRPLLETPRGALREWLEARAIAWREDESNQDRTRSRARLRHDVLPALRELAERHGGVRALSRSLEHLREDRAALESLAETRAEALGIRETARGLHVPAGVDRAEPALLYRLRRYLRTQGAGHPPSAEAVQRVLDALGARGRSRLIDVSGARLRVEAGRVGPAEATTLPLPRPLRTGAWASQPALGLAVRFEVREEPGADGVGASQRGGDSVAFDYDALGAPDASALCLRCVREGDRFAPFGLGGTVRLYRWLSGQGVPRSARPMVPVVALGDEIVWVPGRRRSALAPLTDATTRRLVLAFRASG